MGEPSRRVWAVFRRDRDVLFVSDAELALIRFPAERVPEWVPAESGIFAADAPARTIDEALAAGEVRGLVARQDLRFVDVSGSVLVVQGRSDIPFVLLPEEAAAARVVAERLTPRRAQHHLADVATDIWKWNVAFVALGTMAVLVPLFEGAWGVAAGVGALVGFAARRPACYLMYAVLCEGGAIALVAANCRRGPLGWPGALIVLAFVGLVAAVRWRHFRHARTSAGHESGQAGPAVAAGAFVLAALAGVLWLAVRVLPREFVERLTAAVAGGQAGQAMAGRVPGYLGLLSLGLGLSVVRRRRGRPWGLAALALSLALFGHLCVGNYLSGPIRRPEPVPATLPEEE